MWNQGLPERAGTIERQREREDSKSIKSIFISCDRQGKGKQEREGIKKEQLLQALQREAGARAV